MKNTNTIDRSDFEALMKCTNIDEVINQSEKIIDKEKTRTENNLNCITSTVSMCYYVCVMDWNYNYESLKQNFGNITADMFNNSSTHFGNIKKFKEIKFNHKELKDKFISLLKKHNYEYDTIEFTDSMLDKISDFSEYFELDLIQFGQKMFFYIKAKENSLINCFNTLFSELIDLNRSEYVISNGIEIVPYYLAVLYHELNNIIYNCRYSVSMSNSKMDFFTFYRNEVYGRLKDKYLRSLNPAWDFKIDETFKYYGNVFIMLTEVVPSLCMPFIKPNMTNILNADIMQTQYEDIEKKNSALKKSIKDKNFIINDFSHTYGNMTATTLENMGNTLLKSQDENIRHFGRLAMVEYSIKQNLTKNIEILKLKFEDNIEELRKKLINSVHDTPSENSVSIKNIVSKSWERCFMTLLYDEGKKTSGLRHRYFEDDEDFRKGMQNDFEIEIFVKKNDILEWIENEELFDLKINISGLWENLYFDTEEYSALLFTDWLSELFRNIMKYADIEQPIYIDFSSETNYLEIHIKNQKNTAITTHNTQQGVKSIEDFLKRLGQSVSPVNVCQTDELYEINIKISNDIFVKGI